MRLRPTQLGPWPEGQDTFHQTTHSVFTPTEDRAARLAAASNVDLDDEGWSRLRAGKTLRVAATAGKEVFSALGLLLMQDGGVIKKISPSDWSETSLVTGLDSDARVIFHEHAGQIFYTNGVVTGRIKADGTATNWGCSVAPSPALSTTAGSLRAGRYQVSALFVDADDVEHGAGKATVLTLANNQNIVANLGSVDTNATHVRFFVTRPNGTELFFAKKVAVGGLPATISDVEVSEEPLRTQHMSPPLPADGIFSYRGLLILFAENFLFPSAGVNAHLYELTETLEGRPSNIQAGVGLADGFWTVCERGAFWTTGSVPQEWQTWQKDGRRYAKGGLKLPGYLVPRVQTSEEVALFASSDGLIAGLPGGVLIPLSKNRQHFDVDGKRAVIIYRESGDLRQILVSLETI